jgi:hypothetical protein
MALYKVSQRSVHRGEEHISHQQVEADYYLAGDGWAVFYKRDPETQERLVVASFPKQTVMSILLSEPEPGPASPRAWDFSHLSALDAEVLGRLLTPYVEAELAKRKVRFGERQVGIHGGLGTL